MQIFSVTEHINTLSSTIDQHIELINNVELMRSRQRKLKFFENDPTADFYLVAEYKKQTKAAEKLVDESLIKLKTGGENNAAKKNQNA